MKDELEREWAERFSKWIEDDTTVALIWTRDGEDWRVGRMAFDPRDRIESLSAKLEKAREALEGARDFLIDEGGCVMNDLGRIPDRHMPGWGIEIDGCHFCAQSYRELLNVTEREAQIRDCYIVKKRGFWKFVAERFVETLAYYLTFGATGRPE